MKSKGERSSDHSQPLLADGDPTVGPARKAEGKTRVGWTLMVDRRPQTGKGRLRADFHTLSLHTLGSPGTDAQCICWG